MAANEHLDGIENVAKLVSRVRLGIWALATVCVITFSWLQIDKSQVFEVLNSTKPDLFLKVLIIAYYLCWVGGATIDLNLQHASLVRDPNQGQLPTGAYIAFAAFAACTIVLLWASSSDQRFAGALALFWVVGTAGGEYLNFMLRPMFRESGEYLRHHGDYFRLEKLLVVARFQLGRWQRVRNAFSFALVLLINITAFVPAVRTVASQAASSVFPGLQSAALAGLMTDFAILLFILVTEGWIYLKRLEALMAIRVIDDLRKRYILEMRAKQDS